MMFRRAFSGAPWESRIGYCRALRAGDHVYVTGTTAVGALEQGAYGQARRCLEIIEKALRELGASMADVVRTRMFVTDISKWEEFGRAHGEVFAAHPPATTMVEVKALIDPKMLIEIEADAVVNP
ncbi:MAG: RidA family protein [Deltaproteobacteria bacterium]|nr:MAG: RidA family protein [Deltaproteobacteria bacterium]